MKINLNFSEIYLEEAVPKCFLKKTISKNFMENNSGSACFK